MKCPKCGVILFQDESGEYFCLNGHRFYQHITTDTVKQGRQPGRVVVCKSNSTNRKGQENRNYGARLPLINRV